MGIESFYINLELNEDKSYDFSDVSIIFLNKIDNKVNITISFALVSFFDGTYQMYSFISRYRNYIISAESLKEDIIQSIVCFDAFLGKMYDIWKDKIKNFHTDYGRFLIKPNSEFYKNYKKIRKYMHKSEG